MTIRAASTQLEDPAQAAQAISQQLGSSQAEFVLFFASPRYSAQALGDALSSALECPSIGCTTAGEFAGGKILEGALVAMAFDAEHLERVGVAAIADVHSEQDIRAAYASLIDQVLVSEDDAPEQLLGLVLQDGLSGAEEQLMATLSSVSNIPFVGGSAGDAGRFERTFVFVNGQPSTGSAALALLRLKRKYSILKTQSFHVSDATLAVTRADEATRRVIEFNGKPACEEYARVLGVSTEQLPELFQKHPLGLMVDGEEPFVRSPQRVQGSDVVFYCNVRQGMELRVLDAKNIVEDTRRDLEQARAEFGEVTALLNFHCILRTLQLEQEHQAAAYAALFESPPTIGFSTYGESYIGHINHTSVIVLLA